MLGKAIGQDGAYRRFGRAVGNRDRAIVVLALGPKPGTEPGADRRPGCIRGRMGRGNESGPVYRENVGWGLG